MVGISIKPPSKDLLRIVSYAVVNLMMSFVFVNQISLLLCLHSYASA